jgi:uncharacterized membrane protein YfcA
VTPTIGLLLFAAAAAGGAINSVAGGGSFVAFPALLFAGVAPVPANATNTIALWPGSVASAVGYRSELQNARRELLPLGVVAACGGLAGAFLLLRTSDTLFVVLIPWLLLFAATVFSLGPRVSRWLASLSSKEGVDGMSPEARRAPVGVAVFVQLLISVYGGYFGGGMGIMMLAVLAVLGMTNIHEMNGTKNVLGSLINGVAVATFIIKGAVAWAPGVVMIAGGITGGYVGARVARRVKPAVVRRLVLVIAWSMTAYFFVKTYAI